VTSVRRSSFLFLGRHSCTLGLGAIAHIEASEENYYNDEMTEEAIATVPLLLRSFYQPERGEPPLQGEGGGKGENERSPNQLQFEVSSGEVNSSDSNPIRRDFDMSLHWLLCTLYHGVMANTDAHLT
jgi:hypothetical protein